MGRTLTAAAATAGSAAPSMFDDIFKHCHWDNSVFVHGIFWLAFLAITYAGTLYYKCKEAREEEEKQRQAAEEKAQLIAKRRNAPVI